MGSFYMEATQINYRRDEALKTVDQKLQELSETSAIDTDIAPVFKSTNTYAPGDMVYYRNKLYVFNVEHTGAWSAADVTATDVTTEISSLKSGLTNLTDAVGWDNHKNLLPMTLSHIKAINTDGTWSGNVYSVNSIDYTISLDSNGAINKITANGTAQYDAYFVLADNAVLSKLSGKNIVLNGATGGSTDTYLIQAAGYNGINSTASRDGDSANFTPTTSFNEVRIIITGGKTVTNVDFYPMLRLVGANATFDVYHPVIGPAVEELQSELTNLIVLRQQTITISSITANSSVTTPFQPEAVSGYNWAGFTPIVKTDGVMITVGWIGNAFRIIARNFNNSDVTNVDVEINWIFLKRRS